jgi:hypothetical protein
MGVDSRGSKGVASSCRNRNLQSVWLQVASLQAKIRADGSGTKYVLFRNRIFRA